VRPTGGRSHLTTRMGGKGKSWENGERKVRGSYHIPRPRATLLIEGGLGEGILFVSESHEKQKKDRLKKNLAVVAERKTPQSTLRQRATDAPKPDEEDGEEQHEGYSTWAPFRRAPSLRDNKVVGREGQGNRAGRKPEKSGGKAQERNWQKGHRCTRRILKQTQRRMTS